MPLAFLSFLCPRALTRLSPTLPAMPLVIGRDIEILARERMPVLAKPGPSHDGRHAITSRKVDGPCHRFEVVGINARTHAAQMIEVEAGWNWADKPLIHDTMRDQLAPVDVRVPVPPRADAPLPHPARRRISPILNEIVDRRRSGLVAGQIAQMSASEDTVRPLSHRRYGGWLSATAHAQARRIQVRHLTLPNLPAMHVLARLAPDGIGRSRLPAINTDVRLGVHVSDLLRRSGAAVPGVFAASPGVFIVPKTDELVPFLGVS
jgi:hypothetical protein